MANDKVITGPLAVVKVNGLAIGKMKGIRVNENFTRGEVKGLGELTPQELPALSWAGTLTCDFYNIDFSISQIPGAITRTAQTVKDLVNSILLQSDGVTVDIYKKVPVAGQPGIGLIVGEEAPYCSVKGLFIDTESFDINEGQISGRNQSFKYLYPVIKPA